MNERAPIGAVMAVHSAQPRPDLAQDPDRHAAGLWRLQMVYVHDFAVSAGAGVRDEADGRVEVSQIARAVTLRLAEEITRRGLPAVAVTAATRVAGPSLAVEGQYLSIGAEGYRRGPTVIGVDGADVRTLVQLFETSDAGRWLVEDFYVTVLISAASGPGTVSPTAAGDATRAAEAIADVLARFFDEQGWLAPR